jgi:hypothetical protein
MWREVGAVWPHKNDTGFDLRAPRVRKAPAGIDIPEKPKG